MAGTSTLQRWTIQYYKDGYFSYRSLTEQVQVAHIRDHNSRERSEEHSVPVHKIQKPTRRCQYLPRTQCPSAKQRAQHLSSANVDELGKQDRHVVRSAQAVRRDVGANGGQAETEGREECRGAVVPTVDNMRGIP